MLYQCISRIQPVASWFLQSFWLTTHTHAAVWLPKSCNQCVQFSSGLLEAWFRRKEVESAAVVGLCCMHNACAPMRCCLKEKEISSVVCLIASNICWDGIVRYPINTVHWLSLQSSRRTTPIFYRATDTVTDLVNIHVERVNTSSRSLALAITTSVHCATSGHCRHWTQPKPWQSLLSAVIGLL